MGKYDLRQRVGLAIHEGNTFEWFIGWMIKLLFEGVASLIVASILTRFAYLYLGFDLFNELVGTSTSDGALLLITVFVFREIFFCDFDRVKDD